MARTRCAAVVRGGYLDVLFRSTALSLATREHTKVEWETYKNGVSLGILYTLAFWKQPPGGVGVAQAQKSIIQASADAHYARLWERFLATAAAEGFKGVLRYAEECAMIRDKAQVDLKWFFLQVARDNEQVIVAASEGIRTFAQVKLAGQVGLAACGLGGAYILVGGAAWLATGVSIGGSMGVSIAKNWSEENTVEAVAIDYDKENAKFWIDKALGTVSDHNASLALSQIDAGKKTMERAEQEIARQAKINARRSPQRIAAAEARWSAANQSVGQGTRRAAAAKTGQVIAKGLPILFFGLEVYDAVADYKTATRGL